MKRLFIVGAKLIGLVCLWWAIFIFIQIISVGGLFVFQERYGRGWIFVVSVMLFCTGLLAYIVLALWFSSILLFRTEWLALKVGLDKDGGLPGWPEEKKLLRLGILLLGFFILVHAIPETVKSCLTVLGRFMITRDVTTFLLSYVIPILGSFVGVAMGFVLIFMPNRVIGWVEKMQKKLEYKLSKAEG